jgi:glycosyltransferase involved in cell wall biosynthesis
MLDPYFIDNFPLKHLKKSLFYRLIAAPVLSNALATLFTCEEERRLANTSYKPVVGTRRVVRYGINPPSLDLNTYDGRLTELKEKLAGKDIILYLGRIHPKKGCDLAVDAMSAVANRHPNVHLIMAGPDQTGLGARLQKASAQKGLAERISWVGPVYGDERWYLYNIADAFILPSHMENFGMTVAESLSQSCPVLISDKVNIYDSIVQNNAGFVAPDTLDGTIDLLDRWCSVDRSQRSAMRENAYQLFDLQFRASYTADDVAAVFQEAVQASAIAA